MTVDHIGIAVKSIEEALPFYTDLLGFTELAREEVASEEVRVVFLDANNVKIELLEATSDESAIARFIEKRGEGLHHVGLKIQSIEERIADLKTHGIRMLNDVPKQGAGGKDIAFLHPKSGYGVLYELCESKRLGANNSG